MSIDQTCMIEALALAENGRYTTTPNPRVGCVIVKDGDIVGRGFHEKAGQPHAEINALNDAGDQAKGATAYVTLEPCSHEGKTGPCAQALIAAGIKRVVYAMEDPNPSVSGRGIELLEYNNIATQGGIQEAAAFELNRGFIKRMMRGLPHITIKSAMSLDGRTAMASGESKWITCPRSRKDVQKLRASSCAIVTGINSVLHDDPSMTVRLTKDARQPLRVIVDTQLRTPLNAAIFKQRGKTVIATCNQEKADAMRPDLPDDCDIWVLPKRGERVDIYALMRKLASEECNDVLVEAGATLGASVLASGLTDELVIYMSGKILGSTARPLFDLPFEKMTAKLPISIKDIRAVGDDWRITAAPDPEG